VMSSFAWDKGYRVGRRDERARVVDVGMILRQMEEGC
jgi:hypothetical protein